MDKPQKKERRAPEWLVEWPLLRVLYHEPLFRLAFACFCLLVLFLALYVPKFWRVTPDSFNPVVKISGLDVTQAWSLSRTALRQEKEGQPELAFHAWQAAVANYPTHIGYIRSAIANTTLQSPGDSKAISAAIKNIQWLNQLTETNGQHRALIAKTLDHFQLYSLAEPLMGPPTATSLSQPEADVRAKSLFFSGNLKEFADEYIRPDKPRQLNTEIQLLIDAFQAITGNTQQQVTSRQSIEAALNSPRKELAQRLLFCIYATWQSLDRLEGLLSEIQGSDQDALIYHLYYWDLLLTEGQVERAHQGMLDCELRPKNLLETLTYLDLLVKAKLEEKALEVGRRGIITYAYNGAIVRHHSRLLIKREEWDSLRQLALSMRTPFDASAKQILLDQSLIDFSYFLQGRAEFAVNRKRSAKDSFDEISERLSKSEMLNEVALAIDNMGFHEKASELLIAGESVHKQEPDYWLVRFNNAYALKEAEQILVAALAAYQLDESNPVHQNNYAAALLIHRAKPEEALTLTKSLLTAYPYSFQAQINHALALAQNKQPEAALKIIRQIPRERLISMENSFVNLALFDSHLLRSETAQAKETAEAINPDHLLPLQQEWLESQLEQLISSK